MLIAAQSGRALAAAARRAGYVPLVADLFGDLDTRRIAGRWGLLARDTDGGIAEAGFVEALMALAKGVPATRIAGLAYASGFEDRPWLLEAASRHWPLLGNAPRVLRDIKDPLRFARLCHELGIAHPQVALAAPAAPAGWLVKRVGGSGGAHVAAMRAGDAALAGRYFQRRVSGASVSALFCADGCQACLLGFSSQWADPAPAAPFRFGGAAGPVAVAPAFADAMNHAVAALTRACGLHGLNSADFALDAATAWLLEINPRPGATLDVFDAGETQMFAWHRAGCEGGVPNVENGGGILAFSLAARNRALRTLDCEAARMEASNLEPAPLLCVGPVARENLDNMAQDNSSLRRAPLKGEGPRAIAIAYAEGPPCRMPALAWPAWAMDRQSPGTLLTDGAPVCTVLGEGQTVAAARASALRRAGAIQARLRKKTGGEAADGQRG